jgi:DsbC/DsbD-like thiol-disulfide interchange protein
MLAASPRCAAVPAFLLLSLTGVCSAHAQDASAWDKQDHAAARLIAGTMIAKPESSVVRAGLEIRLQPGWKTYWRYPGDSGSPPSFSFAGSENVKSVTVQWPAPEEFPDGAGGHAIGYKGDVILPLVVTPADPARATSLHLKLNYAICGNLCVPGEAALQVPLPGSSASETTLAKAEQQVPRRIALGATAYGLGIRSVQRVAGSGHERVVVEVAAPEGAPVELFVEGPTPEWALPIPEQTGPAAALRRFTFDLDGLPPGAQAKGATLTFTAVSGGSAVEVPAHLD